MSQLVCMHNNLSIDTPNTVSIRSAIAGKRRTRSFNRADNAEHVTSSAVVA